MDNIIVVGAGVSGLSVATVLAEAGYPTRIVCRDLPEHSTSAVAAAFWEPFLAEPPERIAQWASVTWEHFEFCSKQPEAGVTHRDSISYFRAEFTDPDWSRVARDYRRLEAEELRAGFAAGHRYSSFVVEMPIYLKYLQNRLMQRGGTIEPRELKSLDELQGASVIVNCSGLGARELVNDPLLTAIQGQIVQVEKVKLEAVFNDDECPGGLAYVVPRSGDVVLGGTTVKSEVTTPDAETERAIVERCRGLCPELANARILGSLVGLRPVRNPIRLEAEKTSGGSLLVHNYGHGGSGVTVSWGAAMECLQLVQHGLASKGRG